jgi:hypothetical protein
VSSYSKLSLRLGGRDTEVIKAQGSPSNEEGRSTTW